MLMTFYGNYEYWNLYHKVTFDYFNLLIIVNPGVTELDIKRDVYSSWKEWIKLEQNTGKSLPALRTIAGDPTTGGQTAGDIYFTQNGWRIQLDPSIVSITGVIFSDDFESPLVSPEGDLLKQSLVSSLVTSTTVTQNVVTGDIGQVGSDVRTELTPELTEISETRTKVEDIPTDVWSKPKSEVQAVSGSIGEYVAKKLLDFARWFSQK